MSLTSFVRGILYLLTGVSLFLSIARANTFSLNGIPAETVYVRGEDGTPLTLVHLLGNRDDADKFLLEPGLISNFRMFGHWAKLLYEQGYDVYIGQTRRIGRGLVCSGKGPCHTLEDICLKDILTHLKFLKYKTVQARKLSPKHTNPQVHYMGHSMGAMAMLAILPRFGHEFVDVMGPITLLTAPHKIDQLKEWIRRLVDKLDPVIKTFDLVGIDAIKVHHRVADQLLKLKQNFITKTPAMLLEKILIQAIYVAIHEQLVDKNFMSPKQQRDFVRRHIAEIHIEVLKHFREALYHPSGDMLVKKKEKLLQPEKIIGFEIQVVGAEHDILVPWENQVELYHLLQVRHKRLLKLNDMYHVDPVSGDLALENIAPAILEFHDHPKSLVDFEGNPVWRKVYPTTGHCAEYLFGENK